MTDRRPVPEQEPRELVRPSGMNDRGVVILRAHEIDALLAGREGELIDVVCRAYVAHRQGRTSLPHSTFLRFPEAAANRIIALPAFLGDGFEVAGVKWIASFPGNVQRGMARASAVLILNSCSTGRPEAILESSLISAKRTAASAAAAARALTGGARPRRVGLIGTGVINFEVARFLRAALPGADRFLVFDLDRQRAEAFAASLGRTFAGAEVELADAASTVLAECELVSFATTAARPHVADLSACPPGAVVLHVSLRDLSPQAILASDNVVDDADHVCRAETSVHLAEQLTGSRGFIRCTLADILAGAAPPRDQAGRTAVFSPFGLGILDLAVGKVAFDLALSQGQGSVIDAFLPE